MSYETFILGTRPNGRWLVLLVRDRRFHPEQQPTTQSSPTAAAIAIKKATNRRGECIAKHQLYVFKITTSLK
jgi:hypothetical protein